MLTVPMGAANAGMLVRGARIEGVGYTLYPHTGVRLVRTPGATARRRGVHFIPSHRCPSSQHSRGNSKEAWGALYTLTQVSV
jgi:hypothetical protein